MQNFLKKITKKNESKLTHKTLLKYIWTKKIVYKCIETNRQGDICFITQKIISAVTLSRPVVHLLKLFLQLEVMTRTAKKEWKNELTI